jgi:hypothetical protein
MLLQALDNTTIAHAYVLSNIHCILLVIFNLLRSPAHVPLAHLAGRGGLVARTLISPKP